MDPVKLSVDNQCLSISIFTDEELVSITEGPENVTVTAGDQPSFTCGATCNVEVSFDWTVDGNDCNTLEYCTIIESVNGETSESTIEINTSQLDTATIACVVKQTCSATDVTVGKFEVGRRSATLTIIQPSKKHNWGFCTVG